MTWWFKSHLLDWFSSIFIFLHFLVQSILFSVVQSSFLMFFIWLVSNIFYFPLHFSGMSSFPLTWTPSFFKMGTLHHQPDTNQIPEISKMPSFEAPIFSSRGWNFPEVAVAQRAPLEQRHAVCATISTAVALFSGFFNILTPGFDVGSPWIQRRFYSGNHVSLVMSSDKWWLGIYPLVIQRSYGSHGL